MSKIRLCPNCFIGEIRRPDQQTCCYQCSTEWKNLGPDRRKERIRQASKPLSLSSILPSSGLSSQEASQEYDDDKPTEPQFDIDKILPPKKD